MGSRMLRPFLGACVLALFAFLWIRRQPAQPPASSSPPAAVVAVSPSPAMGMVGGSRAVPGQAGPGFAATGALVPSSPATHALAGPGATPLNPGAGASEPGASPTLRAETAVEAIRSAVQKFGATFGGNPVGTNAEITRALNGDNPTHAVFLSGIPGQQINSNGELVDPWGTPYFFHQLSGHDMEVRSAGPDRIMWNGDDIVFH